MPAKLSIAQRQLLADIRGGRRTRFNGRARRSLEKLREAGLVRFETDLRLSANGSSAEILTVTWVLKERCYGILDRGEVERPRHVFCQLDLGHSGPHFAAWPDSEKLRQTEWSDSDRGGDPGIAMSGLAAAVTLLTDFAETLPEGHDELPGVTRAIEILEAHRPQK